MAQLLQSSGVRERSSRAARISRARLNSNENQGNPMMNSRRVLSDNRNSSTVLIDDLGPLVDHLNDDLAGELQSTIMYVQYSAFLRGLHRSDLNKLFQTDISD